MMRYTNKKTGSIIETDCFISGNDWQGETSSATPPKVEETSAEEKAEKK